MWKVLFHPEFEDEFDRLSKGVKLDMLAHLRLLEQFGPNLGRPSADTLKGAVTPNLKELRFRSERGVWRVAFAFDPERRAVILCAGDKGGVKEDQFYKRLMRLADDRFKRYLKAMETEK